MSIQLSNTQSLIYRSSGLPLGRHHILHFSDKNGGLQFLSEITHQITTAESAKNERLINLGISFRGLQQLGLPLDILNRFPTSFADPLRKDIRYKIGDVGNSDPRFWWGGKFVSEDIHCVVHLYAATVEILDSLSHAILNLARNCNTRELLPSFKDTPAKALDTSWPYGPRKVHFGFKDGFSQPKIAWGDELPPTDSNDQPYASYREFVLGDDSDNESNRAFNQLIDGSSYSAFRVLLQDVAGFEKFLDDHAESARRAYPKDNPTHEDLKEWLAAKMIGRWRDGTPLTLSHETPNSPLADQHFGFANDDIRGGKCPITAHIRLANPRDQGHFRPGALGGFDKIPTLIRRGMPFGPAWQPGDNDKTPRGMVGMFITARLDAFELIMNWMQDSSFNTLVETAPDGKIAQDPVAGNRIYKSSGFNFKTRRRAAVGPLSQFVTTAGATALLMPGMKTINQIIELGYSS